MNTTDRQYLTQPLRIKFVLATSTTSKQSLGPTHQLFLKQYEWVILCSVSTVHWIVWILRLLEDLPGYELIQWQPHLPLLTQLLLTGTGNCRRAQLKEVGTHYCCRMHKGATLYIDNLMNFIKCFRLKIYDWNLILVSLVWRPRSCMIEELNSEELKLTS